MCNYACEIPDGADYPDAPPWTNASWMNQGRSFELAALAAGEKVMGFPSLWRLDIYGVPLPNDHNYAQVSTTHGPVCCLYFLYGAWGVKIAKGHFHFRFTILGPQGEAMAHNCHARLTS